MTGQLMMKIAVAAGVLTGIAAAASAHHSGAMYEPMKTITLKGVVKEFQYTNPHSWLWITVTNDDQTTTDWGFEAEGPSTLFRNGIKKNDLRPGDKVTITGRPMRDGRPAAAWLNAVKEDGRVLTPRPAPAAVTTAPAETAPSTVAPATQDKGI
jgi:N6-adenosine-specific RNA methylase IME4